VGNEEEKRNFKDISAFTIYFILNEQMLAQKQISKSLSIHPT